MLVLLVIQFGVKAKIMIRYQDNTIQQPTRENHYASDHIYTSSNGWRTAFGITHYDQSSDPTEFDESYGTVNAYIKTWGELDDQGKIKPTYFRKLETEPCRESDFDLNDGGKSQDSFKFYKPSEEFLVDTKRFFDKL